MAHLFSIGHGNKSIDLFIQELQSFNVNFLIDIRSKPYSKWNTDFNSGLLEILITKQNIKYKYWGKELGGLPEDISCYKDGKVEYDILKTKDYFQNALGRLLDAEKKGHNVAIMCSESNPAECHRTKLIGAELQEKDVNLRHIVGINEEKSQNDVINELTKGLGKKTLFSETEESPEYKYTYRFQSRKAYI